MIDNIIVGKHEANIGISDISDHLPLIFKSYQPKLYKKQPLSLTTRAINEQKCENLHDKSANDAYTGFQLKVQEILDTEAPIKTIRIKPSNILQEPWMSPGLLKSVKKQKVLYKKNHY